MATKITRNVEHLSYEEKLLMRSQAHLARLLEKRRLRGSLINAQNYLKGRYQDIGASPFTVVPSNKTRYNYHESEHNNFHLKVRKNFFTLGIAEHQHRLPREVMKCPSGDIRTHSDTFLCHLPQQTLSWQGSWTGQSPEISYNPNNSVIL